MTHLFAALPVPPPARDAIAALLGELHGLDWPVRWVRPEGVHLTLKFFGAVPDERVGPIGQALREASRDTGPLPLRLAGLGAFPTPRRARVIWIGVEAPAALELLQHRVERGCEPLGYPTEGNPFRPHVTLGRVRQGARLPPSAARRLAGRGPDDAFLADTVVLFESRPGRNGSDYLPRLILPLGGA